MDSFNKLPGAGWVIFYHTKKPREPEVIEDLPKLLERVRELAKSGALHAIFEISDACVGDFS